jgi:opacity protein-like surface antigen
MRVVVVSAVLVLVLGVASPAQAQFRDAVPAGEAGVQVYDTGGSGFTLNKLFSPQHFKMNHSFEMSMGSGYYGTTSLAMYTNSLIFNFSNRLAARADIAIAYSPFNSGPTGPGSLSNNGAKVFLRNAEISYKPKDNMLLQLSVRQSPYGRYMSPYGSFYPGYYPY